MSAKRIAFRYGKALLDAALERDELVAVKSSLAVIHQSIEVHSDLKKVMLNPLVNSLQKRKILARVLEQSMEKRDKMPPSIDQFLYLLALKNRFEVIREICIVFEEETLKRENRQKATVYSVQKLKESQLDILSEKLTQRHGYTFILTNEIDPKLLGGIRIKIKDRIYDYSIKSQLNALCYHLQG